MIPFITYTEAIDGVKRYFILQKGFPNYVGEIQPFPNHQTLASYPISGHRLWINFAGRIDGNFIPSYATVMQEIDSVFESMARWYWENEISENERKYLKFKIV